MIDIRSLTPNCHVMLGDKRVKVVNIDSLNNLIGVEEYYYVAQDGTKYCIGNEPKNLDPIPITEELLEELMPKDGKSEHCGDIHSFIWDFGEYHIVFTFFGEINVVEISRKEENHFKVQVCNIEHLHELEAFVYLTTKQELI